MELGRMYQEIAELVHQQEPMVQQIDEGAQDVRENVHNANKQMDSAIDSARRARKWKWYALLICSKSPVYLGTNEANDSPHHRHRRGCCGWCDPSRQQSHTLVCFVHVRLLRLISRLFRLPLAISSVEKQSRHCSVVSLDFCAVG